MYPDIARAVKQVLSALAIVEFLDGDERPKRLRPKR